MSRLDGRYIDVETGGEDRPLSFLPHGERTRVAVTGWAKHWREWVGILDGDMERDIWHVATGVGPCELHHLRQPTAEDDEPSGYWLIFRWDD